MSRYFNLLIAVSALFIALACSPTNNDVPTYHVKVSSNPADAGVITPSPDSVYEEGDVVSLSTTASEEYVFTGWTGDIESTTNPHQLTVDQNYAIIANFELKSYDLSISTTGQGTVSEQIIESKSKEYEYGTVVQLTAQPESGYYFAGWHGDLSSTENPVQITVDEPKTITADFQPQSTGSTEESTVQILVDWQTLDEVKGKQKATSISDSITHFGARLVYVNENAVFAQSVEKSTAEQEGVITLDVPSTEEARLFAVAVRHVSGEEKAYLLGAIDNISIEEGKQYNWTSNDFTWTQAHWEVDEQYASDYQSGELSASKDEEKFSLPIYVTDPFRSEEYISYDASMVKLNGTASRGEYSNGMMNYNVTLENPTVGTENLSSHTFFPYLDSQKFNLPSARYVVGKQKGQVDVNWQ